MRERMHVVMDRLPKETLKEFVARWYGYNSCSWSDYAMEIFNNDKRGGIFIKSHNYEHCVIFGTSVTARKCCIKYSETFVKNLGEI